MNALRQTLACDGAFERLRKSFESADAIQTRFWDWIRAEDAGMAAVVAGDVAPVAGGAMIVTGTSRELRELRETGMRPAAATIRTGTTRRVCMNTLQGYSRCLL